MTDMFSSNEHLLPVVPIRDGIVFPNTEMILTFGRQRSVASIEAAQNTGKKVIFVMQRNQNINDPVPSDLFSVGVVGEVVQMMKNEGEINALIRGITKVDIGTYEAVEPFFVARASDARETVEEDEETKALSNHLVTQLKLAVKLGKTIDFLTFMNIMSATSPLTLSYQIASILDLKPRERQELLEITSVKERFSKESFYVAKEVKVLELEQNIASKTQEKFDKNIKEQVLRERIKTIEKELGDTDENKEIKEIADKIKKSGMPEEVRKKAEKELARLAQMSQYNPETSYVRTYLDTLTELPWDISSPNNVHITEAGEVLNEDHYGLDKIKERILEYLAVMKLRATSEEEEEKKQTGKDGKEKKPKKHGSPTILCFVGPPGVGKTSIGKSIARSLGRKFVKMSLGGIRDEAEIRGHRRTYVGALPGRIIQGVKQAGTKNPVFMLDEIDKVGADFRGDPSSALLEALDPEQNYAFSDHYLDVPFDLSDVFFITTCNVLDTIPPALRDRLEIIHFAGYTEVEKFHIVKDFLLEKQRVIHGIPKDLIEVIDDAILDIIRKYTREAGVRNLERQTAALFRKTARKIADTKESERQHIIITSETLPSYLGPYKFASILAEKKDEIGMTTGMAWTEAGGEILFIEVAIMPGRGGLILTGQLGDVMKESATAAMSYVRSRHKSFGLVEKFFQKVDVHVHVPEGAVPKDGPSAGAAIATAIVSAFTKIPAKRAVSMTGEITLRGRVTEIGGVKEKVIAAHRAGIRTVILPKSNEKDLEDIPKEVAKDLTFHFVEHIDEVLGYALAKKILKK